MFKVKVGIFPGGVKTVKLEEGATIADALKEADYNPEGYSLSLNGFETEDFTKEVKEKDIVSIKKRIKGNSEDKNIFTIRALTVELPDGVNCEDSFDEYLEDNIEDLIDESEDEYLYDKKISIRSFILENGFLSDDESIHSVAICEGSDSSEDIEVMEDESLGEALYLTAGGDDDMHIFIFVEKEEEEEDIRVSEGSELGESCEDCEDDCERDENQLGPLSWLTENITIQGHSEVAGVNGSVSSFNAEPSVEVGYEETEDSVVLKINKRTSKKLVIVQE